VKPTVRQVLADSQVAGVAILIALLSALVSAAIGTGRVLSFTIGYLATALAIRGIPYEHFGSEGAWLMQTISFWVFVDALVCLGWAWILARWVFGHGPLGSLKKSIGQFARSFHV